MNGIEHILRISCGTKLSLLEQFARRILIVAAAFKSLEKAFHSPFQPLFAYSTITFSNISLHDISLASLKKESFVFF